LHSETLPDSQLLNIKTVYPPLSLIIFYLGYLIDGESFWGIKILLLIFELFTFLGLFLILKELKLSQKNILIYVLAPLPIFQFFIDAHLDGFGITLLVFSIYFFLKNKKVLSEVLIGLSICIKPLGLILIPVLFITEKGIKCKIQTILIPLIVCALLYLPFIPSANVFEALTSFTVNQFLTFVFEIQLV
jgi:Gpi18-like mannosyltransferase